MICLFAYYFKKNRYVMLKKREKKQCLTMSVVREATLESNLLTALNVDSSIETPFGSTTCLVRRHQSEGLSGKRKRVVGAYPYAQ